MKCVVSKDGRALGAGRALFLLLVVGFFLEPCARADLWMGNVSAVVGLKQLDKHRWDPAAQDTEVGVMIDFRAESWPVSAVVDLFQANGRGKDTFSLDAKIHELHLGCRKIWNDSIEASSLRPYVGAGVSLARAEALLRPSGGKRELDIGYGPGAWVGAGVYWTPVPNLNIGADVRWSTVPLKLSDERFDAGGLHYGVLVGWRWMGPL
jgi:hypothetical protein